MKYVMFAGVALMTMLAACNQNAVDPNSSLTSARSGASTSTTSGTGTTGNTEVVITQDKLPAAVLTYLSTNYAGYSLVQAEQGTDSKGATYYEVQFTQNGTTKELHFDANGALQANSGGGHGGHGHGPSSTTATNGTGNTEVVITQDKLPAAVLTYLSTNYAGYSLVQAEQGTDSKGTTYYEVQFTQNGATKELHFDANGALLTQGR